MVVWVCGGDVVWQKVWLSWRGNQQRGTDLHKSRRRFSGERGRSRFLPTWFYKIYVTQKFKNFVDNFDTMYYYAELFIERRIKELAEKSCKPSRETERDRAGIFEFLLASGKFTKNDLLASVIDVLFAGVDTTSNTMQWVLYMLAKNPEKQKILRQEVLSLVGNSTCATPETLAQMPYLKAWLRETLRLYPVLSSILRRPREDISSCQKFSVFLPTVCLVMYLIRCFEVIEKLSC